MVEETETHEPAPAVDLPPPPVMAAESVSSHGAGDGEGDSAGDSAADAPDVDELQARLADLQTAMEQLQSGDLDGAEAAIASLEQAMAASKSNMEQS